MGQKDGEFAAFCKTTQANTADIAQCTRTLQDHAAVVEAFQRKSKQYDVEAALNIRSIEEIDWQIEALREIIEEHFRSMTVRTQSIEDKIAQKVAGIALVAQKMQEA